MRILQGKGESVQLVELESERSGIVFGVGVVYNNGIFDGTYYDTLEQATEIYNGCQKAMESYFKKFGTRSE